eukprot:CAMPEP_0194048978 /NCGR_PEP_ID=MMETSP0009_2-20130614/29244_1 /TAXON_ID=210454 /ORGANISM="Grammatophora oceanica, Strain CCMP 410" /LENGTH=315 /DNA_ID=CAMNT_0038695023 /DNA_START=249 /DNA_END=1193 /DNA_ORIENTATION=-
MFTTKNKNLEAIKERDRRLNSWLRGTLRNLVKVNPDKHRKWRPKFFVTESPVYQAMIKIAADTNRHNGKVWVLYAKSCSGKTVSGRYLVEQAGTNFKLKRGMFIGKEEGDPLVSKIAKLIGAPDMDDLSWVNALFEALAGVEATKFEKMRRKVLLSCCFSEDMNHYDEFHRVTSYIGNEAPVMVFDDVRGELVDEDKRFLEIVFELCNLRRVNVFILTDDRNTANELCKMDGGNRVKPLPGFYDGRHSPDEDVNWTEETWMVEDLSNLVFSYYPRIKENGQYVGDDGNAVFVKEGTLPDEALEVAAAIDSGLEGW